MRLGVAVEHQADPEARARVAVIVARDVDVAVMAGAGVERPWRQATRTRKAHAGHDTARAPRLQLDPAAQAPQRLVPRDGPAARPRREPDMLDLDRAGAVGLPLVRRVAQRTGSELQ